MIAAAAKALKQFQTLKSFELEVSLRCIELFLIVL